MKHSFFLLLDQENINYLHALARLLIYLFRSIWLHQFQPIEHCSPLLHSTVVGDQWRDEHIHNKLDGIESSNGFPEELGKPQTYMITFNARFFIPIF